MSERPPGAALFRDVMGRFASGVAVITTSDAGELYGTTASAVCSVSVEPPMLIVCLNQASRTGQAIARSGRFAVNILAEAQEDLAVAFARKSESKFDDVAFAQSDHGEPLLAGVIAHLDCQVVEQVRGGTHSVFLAQVEEAIGRPGRPLAYFRGRFGRLASDLAGEQRDRGGSSPNPVWATAARE